VCLHRRLGITEATVKAHMGEVFPKVGATNRTQVALAVYELRHHQRDRDKRPS
jgi:DNA-binding NarL/FixJ family response regulator